MAPKDILALLQGGDVRSTGRADQAAAIVSKDPKRFPELMAGLWSDDRLIRMRAADAAEKATRKNHALLAPYKKEILGLLREATEKELRWHLAAMVPRLRLNARERREAMTFLNKYLEDKSSIVKTFALQGLTDLAENEPAIQAEVMEILEQSLRSGTPAMKARSRKLLKRLQKLER
ncbi:MAG TPA: hypothetical protein VFB79_05795 [Candidatus Angelobacter sp.]|nr:hypothetical protein [Candidatus Angelobacter sp.]